VKSKSTRARDYHRRELEKKKKRKMQKAALSVPTPQVKME
jgi:hypothetical protein